jgi:hypothetical protein
MDLTAAFRSQDQGAHPGAGKILRRNRRVRWLNDDQASGDKNDLAVTKRRGMKSQSVSHKRDRSRRKLRRGRSFLTKFSLGRIEFLTGSLRWNVAPIF